MIRKWVRTGLEGTASAPPPERSASDFKRSLRTPKPFWKWFVTGWCSFCRSYIQKMANKYVVSYLREVSKTQREVDLQLGRIEALRKRLRSKTELTEEESDLLETELEDIKKGVLANEAKLKTYYGENRTSFMFAVLLMFLSFLFYGVYLMIYGHIK